MKIMERISAGSPAPDFSLSDQAGISRSLSDFLGQWVIVYFYPKDNTPGCTREACSIRNQFPQFVNRSVAVLGISPDSIQSHKKFAEKYMLPFPLLSDPGARIARQFGAWGKKRAGGRGVEGMLRVSFLIDPKGRIAKRYDDVSPDAHGEELLSDLLVFQS